MASKPNSFDPPQKWQTRNPNPHPVMGLSSLEEKCSSFASVNTKRSMVLLRAVGRGEVTSRIMVWSPRPVRSVVWCTHRTLTGQVCTPDVYTVPIPQP